MNLKQTYDLIASDWHKDHQTDDWWIEGTNKFISFLKPGDTVLDVGCGGGIKTKYLTEKRLKVTGIDLSENLIEIAKKEETRAIFQVMDMRDVRELNIQFDAIFAQASLLHIPKNEIPKLISDFIYIVRSNGLLYIAVKSLRENGPEEEVVKENDYGYDYERFFSYYSMDELEKLFKEAGLEVVYKDSKSKGKTVWLQIIGRKVSW